MKQELLNLEEVKECEVVEFQIQDLLPIGIVIIVLGIAIAYGLDVMGDVAVDMACNDTYTFNASAGNCYLTTNASITAGTSLEYNATIDAQEGVAEIPARLPTLVGVVLAAVIIGILLRYLYVKFT